MQTAALRSMLRRSAGIVLLLAGPPAGAQPVTTQAASSAANRPSPFLGAWELDVSRMPPDYGPPPKRVLFTFAEAGAGQWRTTIDITAPDGSVRHMAVRYTPDGSSAPGEGDTSEADSAAIKLPAPDVLVMSLSKNRMLGSVRVYTISADGREMTESAAAVNPAGAPFVRSFHFRRVP